MGIRITGNGTLENNIAKAQKEVDNSLERLSSGVRFTRNDPLPVERSQSDALMSKMKEINKYRQNVNEGLSFTETADAALSQLTNSTIHLKELVAQSLNPSLSDKERQFIFIEYQAHIEEMDRTAATTSYGGRNVLDHTDSVDVSGVGTSSNAKSFWSRVGAPVIADGKDLNKIGIEKLDEINARPKDLGLISAEHLANSRDGVSLDEVMDTFGSSAESIGSSFDEAQMKLSEYRSSFGAATSRLTSAKNSLDVAYENVAAANSRIRDVDYATESTNLARAKILVQAGTSLLAQSNNSQNVLTLIKGLDRNS
ncbi:flagellin [Fluviispira vulneris]|uniref:flagellin n=1 Tax=Fluviispira vulneris TaxID=2763012 RepID=UPI0016476237|nr:flagellin [Fluviispira vulneris]